MAPAEPQPSDDRHPGGATALEQAFNAYYAPLCEFVYRYVLSRDTAHELVQDLFLRIWDLLDSPNPPTLSAPYLFRAARNQALKYLRHERVVLRWRQRAASEPDPASAPADADLRYREVADAVDRAIAELPERCRLVFTLSRERDLANAEIAELLGISVKTVETQMSRAIKTLRRKLAPHLPPD
jgi:RNA polymerase sigma-70 factor (ECF subfamily)